VNQITFDDGWKFMQGDPAGAEAPAFDDARWTSVDLPHDWSIAGPIAADNPTGSPGGFFPAGVGWYRKVFVVPAEWSGKQVSIVFDGAYMLSTVWINGHELGTHPCGYTPFTFNLTSNLNLRGMNTIAVRVDNSRQMNNRWYSGSGLYRHVRLDVRDPLHIALYGICVNTEAVSNGSATLDMSITAENDGKQDGPRLEYVTQVFNAGVDGKPVGGTVASFADVVGEFPITNGVRQRTSTVNTSATLPFPKLWSPEKPNLYVALTTASFNGRVVDTRETTFGVRTISVSVEKGFVLNGEQVKLYGACVHDDNGALGVAAFDRAEVRRVERLKAAGFNAVRCAHNPPAPVFLDACDRLGLLVIDESFDSWAYGKLPQDYSQYFAENWQSDLEAMILRDRNHPSIVMWSLGNEIHDFGTAQGMRNGTKIVERARSLDPTRFTTTAVFWYRTMGLPLYHWEWNDADGLMSKFDIVGYNYEIARYDVDHKRVPFPRDPFRTWASVTDRPYVLGDFVWAGIDYLGESGIGRYYAPNEKIYPHAEPQQFPYHGAYCGDIDITGFRKPISYARNIVWDRGEKLYTSITEPTPSGKKMGVGPWGVIPSRASWTWPGYEGKPLEVQVYSRYDSVRLYLNDSLIGENPTTRDQKFNAVFQVPYAPGILRTAGVQAGKEVEYNILRTVGPIVGLRLTADRAEIAADGQDISFVTVEAVDENGNF
jgi:beta-galactosidase